MVNKAVWCHNFTGAEQDYLSPVRSIMKPEGLPFLVFLCCTMHVYSVKGCEDGGTALNCTFQKYNLWGSRVFTSCGWTVDGGFEGAYFRTSPIYWYVRLRFDRTTGSLTSDKACSTEGLTNCLKFQYSFTKDDVIDLNVLIREDGGEGTDTVLWKVDSGNGGINYALVPIKTNNNFVVVFKAQRRDNRPQQRDYVAIDNVKYVKSPCTIFPADASTITPDTTRTSSLPPSTTTSKTSISQVTASSNLVTTPTSLILSSVTSQNPSTSAHAFNTTMTTSLDESTNNVGAIVGGVLAVLVVIAVVVVAFIFILKRRHLNWCKTCITRKAKKPKEDFHMNASHNVAYSLEDENQNYQGESSRGSSNQNGVSRSSEPTPSQDHTTPEYANVTKPAQTRKINPPASNEEKIKNSTKENHNHSRDHENNNRSVYEFADNAAFCQDHTDTSYVNVPPSNKEETEITDCATASEPSTNPRHADQQGIYHILEQDPEAEEEGIKDAAKAAEAEKTKGQGAFVYNSLHFDRNAPEPAKSGDDSRAVYNHLHKRDEGTYNEVHRDQRVEVIDGEYSHLE